MKRKEMVNLISDNVLSSFFPNMELRLKNLIADAMLAECEKAGMLPPKRYSLEGEEPSDPKYHGLNGWEPENEA